MPEPCPFCAKPIVREYGSFRCKHCAGSSEDLIDMERKARAAEVRKQTRGKPEEIVVPEPPRATKAPSRKAAEKAAPVPAAAAPGRPTKSARLRMVSAAASRIAERKKATPIEEAPPPPPAKKAARKSR